MILLREEKKGNDEEEREVMVEIGEGLKRGE